MVDIDTVIVRRLWECARRNEVDLLQELRSFAVQAFRKKVCAVACRTHMLRG